MARLDGRLELRIDTSLLRRLEHKASEENTTVGALVREAIGRLLSGDDISWRLEALEAAFALDSPVPPDPAEAARLLEDRWAGE